MKMNSLKAAAAFGLTVLLANTAAAQNSAASSPVGYETVSYAAGFNFVGLRLVGTPQATSDVSAVAGAAVTLSAAPAAGDGRYIFEVISGPGVGNVTTADVVGSVATTTDDLSLGADAITADSDVIIRTPQTLEGVFGAADSSSLSAASAPGNADQVWLPNGTDFDRYYVYSLFGTVEWRNVDTDTAIDASQVEIVYTDGVVILGTGAGDVVVAGNVKIEPVNQAVADGFNFLGSVYPAGSTLLSLFGAADSTSLDGASAPGNADQILVPNGTDFDRYYVFNLFGTTEWRNVDTDAAVDPATVSLDASSGYVLLNTNGAAMVNTAAPSFYSNL